MLNVFNRTFSLAEFDSLLAAFQRGATMHVSSTLPSQEYVKQALQIPGMKGAVAKLNEAQKLHDGGKHAESLAKANEALADLGVK